MKPLISLMAIMCLSVSLLGQKPSQKPAKETKSTEKETKIEVQTPDAPPVDPYNKVPIEIEKTFNSLLNLPVSTWNNPVDSVRHYGVPYEELVKAFGQDSKGKIGPGGELTLEVRNDLNLTLIWVLANIIQELKNENLQLKSEIQSLKDISSTNQIAYHELTYLQQQLNQFRDHETRIIELSTKITDLMIELNALKQERRY